MKKAPPGGEAEARVSGMAEGVRPARGENGIGAVAFSRDTDMGGAAAQLADPMLANVAAPSGLGAPIPGPSANSPCGHPIDFTCHCVRIGLRELGAVSDRQLTGIPARLKRGAPSRAERLELKKEPNSAPGRITCGPAGRD